MYIWTASPWLSWVIHRNKTWKVASRTTEKHTWEMTEAHSIQTNRWTSSAEKQPWDARGQIRTPVHTQHTRISLLAKIPTTNSQQQQLNLLVLFYSHLCHCCQLDMYLQVVLHCTYIRCWVSCLLYIHGLSCLAHSSTLLLSLQYKPWSDIVCQTFSLNQLAYKCGCYWKNRITQFLHWICTFQGSSQSPHGLMSLHLQLSNGNRLATRDHFQTGTAKTITSRICW